jgi:hypothetical protein
LAEEDTLKLRKRLSGLLSLFIRGKKFIHGPLPLHHPKGVTTHIRKTTRDTPLHGIMFDKKRVGRVTGHPAIEVERIGKGNGTMFNKGKTRSRMKRGNRSSFSMQGKG